jgi:predicted RNA-binding Zn-ribbon protein involved in translation (DUF1610 family)
MDCPICLTTYDSLYSFPCGHSACLECAEKYVNTEINSRRFPLRCFDTGCRAETGNAIFRDFLKSMALDRAYRWELEQSIADDAHFALCISPSCSGIAVLSSGEWTFECPQCGKDSCARCKEHKHKGKCKEFFPDEISCYAEVFHPQRCPSCRMLVEKEEGCNHITCHCGRHFCYRCGKVVDPDYPAIHFGGRCKMFDNQGSSSSESESESEPESESEKWDPWDRYCDDGW